MSGKQAKILLQHNVSVLLKYACTRRNPEIACVIVLLSLKAGMRAGEIAKLTWDMIITPSGDINSTIELRDSAAKLRSGRRFPTLSGEKAPAAAVAPRSRRLAKGAMRVARPSN